MVNGILSDRASQSVNRSLNQSAGTGVKTSSSFAAALASEMMHTSLNAASGTSSAAYGALETSSLSAGSTGYMQSLMGADTDMYTSLMGGEMSAKDALLLVCVLLCSGMGGSSSEGLNAMLPMLAAAMDQSTGTAQYKSAGSNNPPVNYARSTAKKTAQVTTTGTSKANIPYEHYVPVTPGVVSTQGNRSAALYRQVIDQFNVESDPRYGVYKMGQGDTYCNIFMWDVTLAMGAEIPHYVDAVTGEKQTYPNVSNFKELTANRIYDWLADKGAEYGWREASAQEAQMMANQGKPAITIMQNLSGKGHAQVVCPSADGKYDESRGVTIAQAGSKLYNYASIKQVYSASTLAKVKYYVHE